VNTTFENLTTTMREIWLETLPLASCPSVRFVGGTDNYTYIETGLDRTNDSLANGIRFTSINGVRTFAELNSNGSLSLQRDINDFGPFLIFQNRYYASSSSNETNRIISEFYRNDTSAFADGGRIVFQKTGDYSNAANSDSKMEFDIAQNAANFRAASLIIEDTDRTTFSVWASDQADRVYLQSDPSDGYGYLRSTSRLYVEGTSLFSAAVYGSTTASGSANVIVQSSGLLQRFTSSKKYKTNIQSYTKGLEEIDIVQPRTFQSLCPCDDKNETLVGLIAEDLHESGFGEFVTYEKNGMEKIPNGISYDKIVILLINCIKELKKRVEFLEETN